MTNCNDILCIKTLNTSNPIYTYYCWDFLKVTSLCQQVPSNDCIHEWFIIKTYLFLHGTIEVLVSESFDHSLNWFIQTQNYTRIENTVNLLLVLNCCVLNCYLGFSLILLKGSLDATCTFTSCLKTLNWNVCWQCVYTTSLYDKWWFFFNRVK